MKRNLSSFWTDIADQLKDIYTPAEVAQKLNMPLEDFLAMLSTNPSKDWASIFFKATYCGPKSTWDSRDMPNKAEYYPTEWIIPNSNPNIFLHNNIARLQELNVTPAQLGLYKNRVYWRLIEELSVNYNNNNNIIYHPYERTFWALLDLRCPNSILQEALQAIQNLKV